MIARDQSLIDRPGRFERSIRIVTQERTQPRVELFDRVKAQLYSLAAGHLTAANRVARLDQR